MFALRHRICRPSTAATTAVGHRVSQATRRTVCGHPGWLAANGDSSVAVAAPRSFFVAASDGLLSPPWAAVEAAASHWLTFEKATANTVAATTTTRWLWQTFHDGILKISTLKRRRKMMNKHKLRKRRKKNRMKNKK